MRPPLPASSGLPSDAVQRDVELDGLRGLAVSMVLAWHFIGIPAWSTEGAFSRAIFKIFLLGGAGVDLFFVLSGFLITRITISSRHSNGRFLLAFYSRRAFRILPPYLLLMLIFTVAVWTLKPSSVFNNDIPLWRFLSFTQNFWMAQNATYGPDGVSVTWSVAIEEQFYIIFPLLAVLAPRRLLPLCLAVIALASIGWRGMMFTYDPANNFPSELSTLSRLDGLAAGGLIACGLKNMRLVIYLRENMKGLRIATVACLAALILVRRDSGSQMAYFGHTMMTLSFALVIIYILLNLGSNSKWMQFLRSDLLRFLGKISYSLYLFHPIILASAFLITGYSKSLSGLPQIIILASSLIVAVVFCSFLFNHFESKMIGFGKKFNY